MKQSAIKSTWNKLQYLRCSTVRIPR